MNRYQKLSWLNLIVIAATIIITTAAIAIEFHIRGFSELGIWFITPLVILQYNKYFSKKPQGSDKVVSDERDNLIIKRAVSIAYTTFWIVLVASSFLAFLIIGPRNSVPTITLPLMAVGGGLFMKIVCSVAILVQYGWRSKNYE